MKKIAVIGAGFVGASVAQKIVEKNLSDVILVDIIKDYPQGVSLDINESSHPTGFDCKIKGTNNYSDIKNSDIVIVTAGLPRKPGMSRDDLIQKNANIIKDISLKIKEYARDAIVIVVTNPLDAMVYVTYKTTGFKHNKVIGMAGVLDSARLSYFIAEEFDVSIKDVSCMVLGGHGDSMVPIMNKTTVKGKPISELLDKEKIDELIKRTQNGGGEVVELLKTRSASIAPAASVVRMVESIINEDEKVLPVCAYLNGEYGYKNIFLGVPVILGKQGVKKIVEIDLNDKEKELLDISAKHVEENIKKVEQI
jgi:malate dehydrogenase